jgi:NTP pyrophosphatase (non-canonical NTP hydrolase)
MSFLDLTWPASAIDPIVDRRCAWSTVIEFTADAAGERGPFLVAQCDSALVLSDVKLSIEEWPSEPVTVIHRLGLPDERIFEVEWADLDRGVEADHLTSIYIPTLEQPVAAELVQFDELVHALRTGCPWDREQTHESLKRYLLEECYELLEAIDGVGGRHRREHRRARRRARRCPVPGVLPRDDRGGVRVVHPRRCRPHGTRQVADRHPHVFGSATFESAEALAAKWEAQKKTEKSRDSVMDGIPPELPALLYALKVQKKAAASDYRDSAVPSVPSACGAPAGTLDADSLGELLFGVVQVARTAGLDPEDELRQASRRFVERFESPPNRSATDAGAAIAGEAQEIELVVGDRRAGQRRDLTARVVDRGDLDEVGADDVQAREAEQQLAGLPGGRTADDGRAGAGGVGRVEEVDVEREVGGRSPTISRISAIVAAMPMSNRRSAWITLKPCDTFGCAHAVCTDVAGSRMPSRAARRNIVPWLSSSPASQVSECASKWMSDNWPWRSAVARSRG